MSKVLPEFRIEIEDDFYSTDLAKAPAKLLVQFKEITDYINFAIKVVPIVVLKKEYSEVLNAQQKIVDENNTLLYMLR